MKPSTSKTVLQACEESLLILPQIFGKIFKVCEMSAGFRIELRPLYIKKVLTGKIQNLHVRTCHIWTCHIWSCHVDTHTMC